MHDFQLSVKARQRRGSGSCFKAIQEMPFRDLEAERFVILEIPEFLTPLVLMIFAPHRSSPGF